MKRVDFEIALKLRDEAGKAIDQFSTSVKVSGEKAAEALRGVQDALGGASAKAADGTPAVKSFTQALTQEKNALDELGRTFKSTVSGAKDFTGVDPENLRVQKQVISDYEKELQKVKALRQQKTGTGEEEQLIQVERDLIQTITQERATLMDLEEQVKKTTSTSGSEANNVKKLTNAFHDQKSAVNDLSQTLRSAGNGAKDFSGVDVENIRIQKQVIKDYEKQLSDFEKKRSASGTQNITPQEQQLRTELEKERVTLFELEDQVKKTSASKQSMRTQVFQLREELIRMEMAGQRGTKEFADMQQKLGRLKDAMNDAAQQAKVLANDEQNFQGLIIGISGITGAFSAAQGAMSIFGDENENLQKSMLKVQGALALTIGLQQVAQALNKDSAFMLVTVTRATNGFALANLNLGRSFIKMGMSATAARTALIGLQTAASLGLAVAVVALISLWNKYTDKQEEAKKKTEEAAKQMAEQTEKMNSIAKSYAEQVSKIESLRTALYNENVSHNQKLKVIKQLQEIMPDYNAKLSKEGSVIWENKRAIDAYLSSLEKSLKFKAAQDDLAKIYADIYKMERGQDKTVFQKTYKNKQEFVGEKVQAAGLKITDTLPSEYLALLDKQWAQYEAQVKSRSARLQGLYDQAAGIKEYIKSNDLVSLDSPGKSGHEKKEDPFVKGLQDKKKEYERYLSWKNSADKSTQESAPGEFKNLLAGGNDYMDYLVRQRKALLENKNLTTQQRSEVSKLNNEIAAEGGQIFADPATLEELGTTISYLENKLQKAGDSERAEIQKSINEYKRKKQVIEDTLSDLDINYSNPQTYDELDAVISRLEQKQKTAGDAERADIQKSIDAYKRKKTAMEDSLAYSLLDDKAKAIPKLDPKIEAKLNIKLIGYENAVAQIEKLKKLLAVASTPEEKAAINKSIKAWSEYAGTVSDARTKQELNQGALQDTASIMNSVSGVVGKGAAGWLQYGANILSAVAQALPVIAKLIGGNIAQAFSGAIAQSQTLPPPFNLIQMGASIAAVAAAVASIPEYADGGIAYGRTLGVFGEYSGAQNNPEVVAPLDRLRSLIQPNDGTGGSVEFRIEGRTLVGIMNKMNKINSRT